MLPRSLSLGLVFLAACGGGAHGENDPVRLSWNAGEMFHVAARYKVGEAMNETSPVGLESADATPSFGEQWSDEVVWTYQVVDTDLVPVEGDELYEYAISGDEQVQAIDVVRAWVDPALNDDPALLEADPVVYLVFRADRDRLAAVIEYLNVDGERVEKAWSSRALNRSWGTLSQSMVTPVPTYLAPSAAKWTSEELVLENGSLLTTEIVDDGVVDAYYDDEVGGGLVMSRYEAGMPWPTWTATANVEARLVGDDEVEARYARARFLPDAPESFDYLASLSSTVDIDAALVLDADTMANGFEAKARDGYEPWAGSWWPQSEGALIFGYNDRKTISDRIKADVDPIKKEMDKLSEELGKLDKSSADYKTKLDTYKAKQNELVGKLVKFYDAVLQDLDGGKLKVENGKVVHQDGWSYALNELSPMDKMALEMWARGETYPNPFYGPAWEILNHYSPAGGSWWGHCNGWAGAAILVNEPTASVKSEIKGQTVEYTSADLKGLFSETHYSTYSRFYGERYYKEGDNAADLTPKAFHILVSHYLRDREVPFVFDTTATEEVWNFPVYAVDLDVTETTVGGAGADGKVNVNTADRYALDALPGIGLSSADKIIKFREANGPFQAAADVAKVPGIYKNNYDKFKDLITVATGEAGERTFRIVATATLTTDGVDETHVDSGAPDSFTEEWTYTLVTDKDGNVLRGSWADDEKHPDFAWVPYENPTAYSSGGSENPYLTYGTLLDVAGDAFKRK